MTRFFLTLSCCLALTASLHALEPLSFQELSLLVRSHETPQSIADEASRRKLLGALTAEQENKLRADGASQELLTYLRSPQLLATPEAAAAYRTHHPAPPAPDHFSSGLEAAKTAPNRAVKLSEAFSLSQLEQAKAQATRLHKPLGFIMVWGQFFDKPTSTQVDGSEGVLLHFVEAFKDSLVLIFVRHENELQQVPRAVRAGFFGPDEGGYAPNMAVVDATASEFIVEIPYTKPGAQRDTVFHTATGKINTWLSTHPTAAAGASPAPASR